jgi:hypothetical protein
MDDYSPGVAASSRNKVAYFNDFLPSDGRADNPGEQFFYGNIDVLL